MHWQMTIWQVPSARRYLHDQPHHRHGVCAGILPHVPVASGALFDAGGGQLQLQADEAHALAQGQQNILLSFPHTITFPPSACGYGIMGFDVMDEEGDVVGFSGWCDTARAIALHLPCRVMQ
jgi:hypothetical protein